MNAKQQAALDWYELYSPDYYERLRRVGKDPRSRLYRTDHQGPHLTIYNLLAWNSKDPFVRIKAKTLSMMEYARG